MAKPERIHGIDALRAVAMLLGVLLHTTMSYRVKRSSRWVHDDEFNSAVFDFTYVFVHAFRMPLFFLISGYFCRLLYKRVGEKEFIKRRLERIGIPFLVGVLFIVPVVMFPINIYLLYYEQHIPWQTAINRIIFRPPFTDGVAHLWFLYVLLVVYGIAILVMRLQQFRWFENAAAKFIGWWKTRSFDRLYWPVVLSIPIALIFMNDRRLLGIKILHDQITFIILWGYVFGLGWLLHLRLDILPLLVRYYKRLLLIGTLIVCVSFYLEWTDVYSQSRGVIVLYKLCMALQTFFLTLGVMGFFLRFFDFDSRFWRYVSDASYWVYLVHIAPVATLQLALLHSNVPGWLRFWVVLILASLICFATYQWFVRYTIIGKVLHGKRKRAPHLFKRSPAINSATNG
ncbi:MAG: acyltransferase family protein [Agriterribacter sp.]